MWFGKDFVVLFLTPDTRNLAPHFLYRLKSLQITISGQ